MLVPKLRLRSEIVDGEEQLNLKYFVWDSEKNDFIINNTLSHFDTADECQEAIDWFNSLSVIKAS